MQNLSILLEKFSYTSADIFPVSGQYSILFSSNANILVTKF